PSRSRSGSSPSGWTASSSRRRGRQQPEGGERSRRGRGRNCLIFWGWQTTEAASTEGTRWRPLQQTKTKGVGVYRATGRCARRRFWALAPRRPASPGIKRQGGVPVRSSRLTLERVEQGRGVSGRVLDDDARLRPDGAALLERGVKAGDVGERRVGRV